MPKLNAAGKSLKYQVQGEGVTIKAKDVTGTITIEMFDAGVSMGNALDENNLEISFTTDFHRLFDFRAGDEFQISQSGGTPTGTTIKVGGAKAAY